MALKEYTEDNIAELKPVSTIQVEDKLDSSKQEIKKVIYLMTEEFDGEFSSQLSKDDWQLLQDSLNKPEYNQKLADLLKMESVFD
ncbi:TPA: hypothetical protein CPT90_05760 [Candidatus Gastranaerophilales bacterium HUM_3]|nr:MAG TPA: hypothetical protein CPT90_05760 [Candidatus Gastranaerophilales bacterium HUM_3]